MADSSGVRSIRWRRVFAVLVVAFAIAETLSRVYIRYWAGAPFQTLSFYRWSPYGLVRNNPRLTSPRFRISANGFRNTEVFERQKPPRTLRVLLLGGSVLYAGLGGPARLTSIYGRVSSDQTIAQYLRDLLRADSAMQGVRIEVLNAAINFNRILEVSSGYLSEYVFWEPDVVVVCGSANNFTLFWPDAQSADSNNLIQTRHPWHGEFERIVNASSATSWFEFSLRTAADHLAVAALAWKIAEKVVDRAVALSEGRAVQPRPPRPRVYTDSAYFKKLTTDYFTYTDALTAAARRQGQDIAFFWEHYLAALKGIKPFSAEEGSIYPNLIQANERDLQYQQVMNARVRAHFDSAGTPFIDPLPELRRYSGTVFIDYLHYTPEGNKLMAEVMYDRLKTVFHRRASMLRAAAGASVAQPSP